MRGKKKCGGEGKKWEDVIQQHRNFLAREKGNFLWKKGRVGGNETGRRHNWGGKGETEK